MLFAAVIATPAATPMLAQQQDDGFDRFFNRLDKNSDGSVAKNELPANAQKNFGRIDTDGDGVASRNEMKVVYERLQNARKRNNDKAGDRDRQPRTPRVPDAVKHLADVKYAGTDNARQTLDLLLPKSRAAEQPPLPVIVFIHGGGWRGGHKNTGLHRVLPFVSTGDYAGVSVGYRLTNEAQWPEQIYDCKAAIRWVRANAKQYNLDPERIAVWGSSAGGHLVAMLGTSGDVEHLEGKLGPHAGVSSRVACVVDWFGPADFTKMGKSKAIDHNAPNAPEALLLGGPIPQQLDKAKDASPQTYVSKDDPPFLIMHGDKDPIVPYQQSVGLDQALDAVGVDSALVTVKGAGHGFGGEAVKTLVETFLAKHLLGKDSEAIKDTAIDSTRPRRE